MAGNGDGGLPPAVLPHDLRVLVGGATWEDATFGYSGMRVYRLTGGDADPPRYLKVAAGDDLRADLAAEAARLRWLAGRLPVPRVHEFTETAAGAFLLLSAVPGRMAHDAAFAGDVPRVVRLLAAGLRTLHTLDMRDCPFDQSLAVALAAAGERVRRRLVDESDFDDERQGRTAHDLYAELLATRPTTEDAVFTHGDYSLPNVLLDGEGIGGFIDWSRSGIADRHADLALAARSLAHNWGAEWVPLLFAEYGIAPVDAAKVAYYQLLDEFF